MRARRPPRDRWGGMEEGRDVSRKEGGGGGGLERTEQVGNRREGGTLFVRGGGGRTCVPEVHSQTWGGGSLIIKLGRVSAEGMDPAMDSLINSY